MKILNNYSNYNNRTVYNNGTKSSNHNLSINPSLSLKVVDVLYDFTIAASNSNASPISIGKFNSNSTVSVRSSSISNSIKQVSYPGSLRMTPQTGSFPMNPSEPDPTDAIKFRINIVIYIFLVAIIFSNSLVIIAYTRYKRLRTITNRFVLSLAIADLSVGLSRLLQEIINFWYKSEERHSYNCLFFRNFPTTMNVASLLSLLGVTIDRYISVMHPLRYNAIMTEKLANFIIIFAWLTAFLVIYILPHFFYIRPGRYFCRDPMYNYLLIVYFVFFVLILFTILLIYGKIFYECQKFHILNIFSRNLTKTTTTDKQRAAAAVTSSKTCKTTKTADDTVSWNNLRRHTLLNCKHTPSLTMNGNIPRNSEGGGEGHLAVYPATPTEHQECSGSIRSPMEQPNASSRASQCAHLDTVFEGCPTTNNESTALKKSEITADGNKVRTSIIKKPTIYVADDLFCQGEPLLQQTRRPSAQKRTVSINEQVETADNDRTRTSTSSVKKFTPYGDSRRTESDSDPLNSCSPLLCQTPKPTKNRRSSSVSRLNSFFFPTGFFNRNDSSGSHNANHAPEFFDKHLETMSTSPGSLTLNRRESAGYIIASKTTIMIALIVGSFAIFGLPIQIAEYVLVFRTDQIKNDMLFTLIHGIFLLMYYTGSTVNPYIYAWKNKDFRQSFKQILTCAPKRSGFWELKHNSPRSSHISALSRLSRLFSKHSIISHTPSN